MTINAWLKVRKTKLCHYHRNRRFSLSLMSSLSLTTFVITITKLSLKPIVTTCIIATIVVVIKIVAVIITGVL